MRWLVHTSLAYGAQGISYYVYCCAGHEGAMAKADGTPTPLYHAAKTLNREFAAIAGGAAAAAFLGRLSSGDDPAGRQPLPDQAAFRLDPPVRRGAVPAAAADPGFPAGLLRPARWKPDRASPRTSWP